MKIAIAGLGVVGSAYKFLFEKVGHQVKYYDPNKEGSTSLQELRNSMFKTFYVCVPTPTINGKCDTSILEEVVEDISKTGPYNTVVIKSTVVPGTTQRLIDRYDPNYLSCLYSAEFLRERCATTDVVENHRLLVVGTHSKADFDEVVRQHGKYPQKTLMLTPTQAELLKYYHNCFNAARISFANEFYDLCEKLDEEYTPIKEALLITGNLPDMYLDVNENCRGYASTCLSKDPEGCLGLAEDLGVDLGMIRQTVKTNEKYKKTPFSGTRS